MIERIIGFDPRCWAVRLDPVVNQSASWIVCTSAPQGQTISLKDSVLYHDETDELISPLNHELLHANCHHSSPGSEFGLIDPARLGSPHLPEGHKEKTKTSEILLFSLFTRHSLFISVSFHRSCVFRGSLAGYPS